MTTPSDKALFCNDMDQVEALVCFIMGICLFGLIGGTVLLITTCIRRRRVISRIVAYIYLMKKEGHLKVHVKKPYTGHDAANALTDRSCRTKIEHMREHVTKYFTLDNYSIEGPCFGYIAKNKNFGIEEKKHRQTENVDVPVEEDDDRSGMYECINVGMKRPQSVRSEMNKMSKFSRFSRTSTRKSDDRTKKATMGRGAKKR